MSQMTEKRDAVDVTRLVAGAAKTVTSSAIAGSRPRPKPALPACGRWGGC